MTLSYRSQPLRVTGEVAEWQGRSPERLKAMKDHLERLKAEGIEAIDRALPGIFFPWPRTRNRASLRKSSARDLLP